MEHFRIFNVTPKDSAPFWFKSACGFSNLAFNYLAIFCVAVIVGYGLRLGWMLGQ